jgi:hypothetical protein
MSLGVAAWDDRQGLAEQVREMDLQLNAIVARLEAIKPPNAPAPFLELEKYISGAAQARSIKIKKLRADIAKGSGADQYKRAEDLRSGVRAIAADCLALEQSLDLRTQSSAHGVCIVADALLREYSAAVQKPRSHFVLISEAEHFGPYSAAVHLGYGGLGFWSLSKTAHEFGHLWAAEDAFCGSLQDAFLENHATDWTESHRKELFADVVGVYLLGPAFAFAGLLLDFSPAGTKPSETHPTGDQRAHCVLYALEATLDHHEPLHKPTADEAHRQLFNYWIQARAAAEWQSSLANAGDLEYAAEFAIGRLWDELPQAMYHNIPQAHAVKNRLAEPVRTGPALECRDVVNGAWLARYSNPQESVEIGARALQIAMAAGGTKK